MNITEFDFDLPEELIALRPVHPRSSSKLLFSEKGKIKDLHVSDLPQILKSGDRLIFNDTKVMPALLQGTRYRSGASEIRISVNLDKPITNRKWLALVRPARRIKKGDIADFGSSLNAVFGDRHGEFVEIEFQCSDGRLEELLETAGQVPLPPYITSRRDADDDDKSDYQTVFARTSGAVAAPTASLHFDNDLVQQLTERGVKMTYVTLHVGAGTFLPIRGNKIDDHKLHAERGEISEQASDEINESILMGQRVIAVGTTSLRLIESSTFSGRVRPWKGETDLFIKPGYKFSAISGLMTNFHLPKTTLLVLVASLIGKQRLFEVYRHAIAHQYRFFSYGDSSLLIP